MFDDNLLVLLRNVDILADHGIRTQPQRQSDDKTYRQLTDNLVAAFQSFFVLAEYLDIVVHKAQESQPYRGDNHQQQIDVAHTSQQDNGYQDGDNDDDTAHGRNALLLNAKRVDAWIACGLSNVTALHPLDEVFTKPSRNQ